MDYYNRENIDINENLSPLVSFIAATITFLVAWKLESINQTTIAIFTYITAFLIGGYPIAKQSILKTIRDKKLPIDILMVVAVIGCSLFGYWITGALVIIIFSFCHLIETYSTINQQRELATLHEKLPATAALVRGGFQPIWTPVEQLALRDHVQVAPGERIPVDGMIFKGQSTVDESLLTGETAPISKKKGATVLAGTVNLTNTLIISVTTAHADTAFQQLIASMQCKQQEKSPFQQSLERFENLYVICILISFIVLLLISAVLIHLDWSITAYRAIIVLIIGAALPKLLTVTAKMKHKQA